MIEIYPSQLGFPILFYLTSLGAMFAIGYLIGETKEVNKRIKQLEMEKKNELNEEPKKAGEIKINTDVRRLRANGNN